MHLQAFFAEIIKVFVVKIPQMLMLSLTLERKAPVSEFEIMQEKLKKAKMAMARGFLQRKQAVDRNIARR